MTENRVVVGLDVGTTKVVALVGEVDAGGGIKVLGYGTSPSDGISRGTVVDVTAATRAVASARVAAEKDSNFEIGRAFVSVAGKHIRSINSNGVTGLNPNRGVVTSDDIGRALESARAVALPHNREVLHVIPRSFVLDGQPGIHNPLGLHAYRLEVEAHIITAGSSTLRNLETCVTEAGLGVDRFVLNSIASGELVLSQAERESGVVVIDIGGGTTDVAVYIEGTIWHTAVIEVGGGHITSDIAQVLHLPVDEAERVKIEFGCADPSTVPMDQTFMAQPFGEEGNVRILTHDLARIIEARVDEIFIMVLQELKRSGYDGLLPAGIVLTGGAANLKHIRNNAARVMRMPARIGVPKGVTSLTDKLKNPRYATSLGLLSFARSIENVENFGRGQGRSPKQRPEFGRTITDFLGRLLPGDERRGSDQG